MEKPVSYYLKRLSHSKGIQETDGEDLDEMCRILQYRAEAGDIANEPLSIKRRLIKILALISFNVDPEDGGDQASLLAATILEKEPPLATSEILIQVMKGRETKFKRGFSNQGKTNQAIGKMLHTVLTQRRDLLSSAIIAEIKEFAAETEVTTLEPFFDKPQGPVFPPSAARQRKSHQSTR